MIRIEPRNTNSAIFSYGVPILSALVALILASIPLWFAGAPVLVSYVEMAKGVFGSKFAFSEMLTRATPLMFTGLAAALAFRAKLWNIGAEGQLTFGAIVSGGVALLFYEQEGFYILPIVILAGAIGGMLYASIPAILKTYFNTNEILVSLMLVYVSKLILDYLVVGPW
ncbi:MAG: ABC transporter permease, partial [Paracoccaceae bacterium]|nr:ABC transporter permease [Paracoccaceae bacterium]